MINNTARQGQKHMEDCMSEDTKLLGCGVGACECEDVHDLAFQVFLLERDLDGCLTCASVIRVWLPLEDQPLCQCA